MNVTAEHPILCILCGHPFLGTREENGFSDRFDVLVCSTHTDQELREQGLDDLWGGRKDGLDSPSLFEEGKSRIVGAWEQGPSACDGVYVLLDNGDLMMFFTGVFFLSCFRYTHG